MDCRCDGCGRSGPMAAVRVVCDSVCHPANDLPFRFTYRLCRWCRGVELRRANSGATSLAPLIALSAAEIAAVDDEARNFGIPINPT